MALKSLWTLLVAVVIISVAWLIGTQQSDSLSCSSDSDCAPASCCHPKTVVNTANAPDCSDVMCTMVCEPNTMDCGCGSPVCRSGRCEVNWNDYCISPITID